MKALVVDGYNAIHKIARLEEMLDISLHEARRALTELALEYKRKVGGVSEVSVVFDGKDTYRRQGLSAPPHQVFSDSGEGDRMIIRTVEKMSERYHVIVVSDDNFVRNNSRAYRASVITVAEFLDTITKEAGMRKRLACLAAAVILAGCFIGAGVSADEKEESLKARLNELRQKKAEIKNDYEDALAKIDKETDEKISKLKAEFHKTRDGYLRDKRDESEKIRADYDEKIEPILTEEKKIVEEVGAAIGMNFAKPKDRK